jgi:hypothetical protein
MARTHESGDRRTLTHIVAGQMKREGKGEVRELNWTKD